MLVEMRLRGLGVIRDAVLELGPGLTVVTGETGAGKTMVVTGLGLLLGGRASAGTVRTGATSAVVEGRVRLDPDGPVARRAVEAGAELDDGDELLLSRTVSAEGRSRAHVGGRGVPVGLLSDLADDLVAVHGQNDQIRLQAPAKQRQSLDRFAGEAVAGPLARYRTDWARLREVEASLTEITEAARERAQEAELLRIGLAEVERLEPQPGEDLELRTEAQRLSNAEELRTAASGAHGLLTADPDHAGAGSMTDVTDLLAQARRRLESAATHDPAMGELADRVAELGYLVDDVAAECASYAAGVESDPARLAAVEDRRAALTQLSRVYGGAEGTVDEVLDWSRRAAQRLFDLDRDDDRIAELADEREAVRGRLGEAAARISTARSRAAVLLSDQVSEELTELSMPDARLIVTVGQHPDDAGLPVTLDGEHRLLAARADGVDDVQLLLAPHPGAPPRPLGSGASGGELSRVMLGLEVVLGAADPVPTFVFDEVDAGVGGSAALGVGRRLARLGRTSQVLVVTHLAQVAAFADSHLQVVKSVDGEVTESGVARLDGEDRVRELARMLGGVADSDSARAHADELMEMARAEREVAGAGTT